MTIPRADAIERADEQAMYVFEDITFANGDMADSEIVKRMAGRPSDWVYERTIDDDG